MHDYRRYRNGCRCETCRAANNAYMRSYRKEPHQKRIFDHCWGCGKPAPSGVCIGPHPNLFRRWSANVSGVDAAVTFIGASIDYKKARRQAS